MDSLITVINALSGKPEIYAIALMLAWGLKVSLPYIKQALAVKQSTLDCLIRIESGIKDNFLATQENTRAIKSLESKLATKDDMINILLKDNNGAPVLNGSGSIIKQGVK